MKKIFTILIICLITVSISGVFHYTDAAVEDGTLFLETFEKYTDQTALNENYTNYAYGGTGTEIILNTDSSNAKDGKDKSLKLTSTDNDAVGAVVISHLQYLEGFEGITLWIKNASSQSISFFIMFAYGPMPKRNATYYMMADGENSYTEYTTKDAQYYNIDIDPGFSGQMRIPFNSFTAPVDTFTPIVIQTLGLKDPFDEAYTLYIDSIGIYGTAKTEEPDPTESEENPTVPKGNKTVVLDDIDKYLDNTALTDAGYTINPWTASASATIVTLNKDPENSFEGNSVSVKLEDDNRNPSLQNSFNIIEGGQGFEFWFYNPNANTSAIYISFNWGPFIKGNSQYYVKDFSKDDNDYIERITLDKQYFNMEFEPGFKGFIRIPFESCNAPVDSLLSTSIQIWSLGEDVTGNGNTYYFDNISIYGLEEQAIQPEDKITNIEITSKLYGFVPRIEGDIFAMQLTAQGSNVFNEIRESHTYVWSLLDEYQGVSLSSSGVLSVDETAQMGELRVSCTVKYDANGELDKSLEFKMNLSLGDKLLTSTGATELPPKNSSKDYFKG